MRRWPRCALRSTSEDSARCYWTGSLVWRCLRSLSGESPIGYSPYPRHERPPPASERAPSRLYLPAVTCPTSSALTALWAPSAGSSVNSLTIKEGVAFSSIVVGDGPFRKELTALTRHLALEQRVHFLGCRPDARVLIELLDVLVVTLVYRGFAADRPRNDGGQCSHRSQRRR